MPRKRPSGTLGTQDVLNAALDQAVDALDVVVVGGASGSALDATTGLPTAESTVYGTLGYSLLAGLSSLSADVQNIRLILEQMLALMASENDLDAKRLDEALARNA